ncbi:Hypothetical protein SRAE_1000256000 [Strongyloides ratti]|uniref:Uncharacterized protein n=1 Tax=Strongyloides ratti TaxID=34506 RepID=A0A090L9Y3_STRRB|nr:Hypothetical protein SRAE_1000256000 [Strongyloides ratti]CEF64305.1 Hypothetical protein SRAE_1000256000 [Strongyloides ratti]
MTSYLMQFEISLEEVKEFHNNLIKMNNEDNNNSLIYMKVESAYEESIEYHRSLYERIIQLKKYLHCEIRKYKEYCRMVDIYVCPNSQIVIDSIKEVLIKFNNINVDFL